MKNPLTEKLDSKILKYSVAAGAVLVGARESRAQVVYTNPADQINISDFSIDFDGDGKTDLHVRAFYSTSCSVSPTDVDVMVGKVKGFNVGYYHLGSALNSGVSIGPGGSFTGSSWFMQELVHHDSGQWLGANQKFLGVKFLPFAAMLRSIPPCAVSCPC